jgi:hypothetical protein
MQCQVKALQNSEPTKMQTTAVMFNLGATYILQVPFKTE